MDITLFKNYAEALLEIALDENKVDIYEKNLDDIEYLLSDELTKFFDTPFVSLDNKFEIIDKYFGKLVENYVLYFLKILVEKSLIKYFKNIKEQFDHLANVSKGITEGIIYSPFELSKDEFNKITEVFKNKLNKNISFKVLIQPDLIGGVRILIEDRVYDYSVLNQINAIKDKLLKN